MEVGVLKNDSKELLIDSIYEEIMSNDIFSDWTIEIFFGQFPFPSDSPIYLFDLEDRYQAFWANQFASYKTLDDFIRTFYRCFDTPIFCSDLKMIQQKVEIKYNLVRTVWEEVKKKEPIDFFDLPKQIPNKEVFLNDIENNLRPSNYNIVYHEITKRQQYELYKSSDIDNKLVTVYCKILSTTKYENTGKDISLNDFCCAVFIILLDNGIKYKKPNRGRQKEKSFKVLFSELVKKLLSNENIFSSITSFFGEEYENNTVNEVQSKLRTLVYSFVDFVPTIGETKVEEFLTPSKLFGFGKIIGEFNIQDKVDKIHTILKVVELKHPEKYSREELYFSLKKIVA